MCYKSETQQKNNFKFKKIMDEYQVPSWLKDFFLKIPGENTKIQYWTTYKLFFLWCINHKKVDKNTISTLVAEDIGSLKQPVYYEYFNEIIDNVSRTTIERKLKELKSLLRFLKRNSYINECFLEDFSISKYKRNMRQSIKVSKIPSYDDLIAFQENLSRISNDFTRERNMIIYNFLIRTGLRENELVGLDLDDIIKTDKGYQLKTVSKGFYSKSDADVIDLSSSAKDELDRWMFIRNAIAKPNEKALFINRKGERISIKTIQQIFNMYSNSKITPHMMRHLYGCLLYGLTNDIVYVMEQMRHGSIEVTTNSYVTTIDKRINNMYKI